MTFRRAINRLHLWLALLSALPIAVLSLTGAVLVFEEELLRFEYRRLAPVVATGERRPLDESVAAIRAAFPEEKVLSVRLPGTAHDALVAFTESRVRAGSADKQPLLVFADPYAAQVVGARPSGEGVMPLMRQLHVSFVAGETGRLIVLVSTGIFLVLLGTGLVLWFKRGGGWRRLLLKWDAKGKRFHYDLHANFGFYSFGALFLIGLSGFLIGLGAPWRNFILAATDSQWRVLPTLAAAPAPAPAAPVPAQATPLANALAAADRASPETRAVSLSLPQQPADPIRITRRFWWGSRPTLQVSVDPRTGAVFDIDHPRRYEAGHLIHRLNRGLHSGEIGTAAMRWLWLIASLVPLLLIWTGLKLWWKPRRKRTSQPGAASISSQPAPARAGLCRP